MNDLLYNNLFFLDEEEEAAQPSLYQTFMQDRAAQIGLSFYMYRHLLEKLPKDEEIS